MCPPGTPSCKVLILTPQEEQILTAPNGILATAEQARFLDLVARTGAQEIWCLGDSFHDAEGCERLADDARALLRRLTDARGALTK